ncbi:MAG TPA: SRPBCC domain-containing protein [Candidatus Limnocylindrales bacterium]|nr:SRPBCC domain-containing protein [Candidatus Limnocylindrales bacterium]
MSYDYTVSKVVDAPASTVWLAWTTTEGTAGIFRARPETVTVDTRPGGAFAVTMTLPDGSEDSVSGTFVELVPNERLVTRMDTPDGPTSPMVMELEEVADGRTRVTFTQACSSAQERDFSKEGSQILLEWVADYVTKA